jgi:Ca2+-transporting ATPase
VLGLSFLQGLSTLVAVFAIFLYAIANGLSDGQVRTATFAALMAGNLMLISVNRSWHLGMVRTIRERHNPVFRWVIGIAMVVTLLLVSVPAVQSAFRFEGIPASMVALSCAAGAVGPVWFEAYKRKARDFGH